MENFNAIVLFPLFAFNKCKYGSGFFCIKVLSRQSLSVNWQYVFTFLSTKRNYFDFYDMTSFSSYVIANAAGLRNLILKTDNELDYDLKLTSNYYSCYKITLDEYLMFFDIYKEMLFGAISSAKLKRDNEFSMVVEINISDISNLYSYLRVNIKEKISKFKESFNSFFYYNEFILIDYRIDIDTFENKVRITFIDNFSVNVDTDSI